MNVKGKLLFYTDTGDEVIYSLKDAQQFTRPGCLRCPDFAAEHADISFGGLGQSEGWTLSIVRTERGQDIWDRATADGVIEHRPGAEDPKAVELMFKLAAKSRERWPSPEEMPVAGSTPGVLPVLPDQAVTRPRTADRRPQPGDSMSPLASPIIRAGPERVAPCRVRGTTWLDRSERRNRCSSASGMLAAVAYSAERLLLSSDWRDAIDDVLMHLGVAAGVSRAYLIEVGTLETGFRATQLAEWCAPGVASQFENPTLRGTPLAEAGFARWIELMSSRATVHGVISEFPEEERARAHPKQDIRSIAAFPVFVDGDWWAFIGFDDCFDERGWTVFELDSLRAAAGMLGAAEQADAQTPPTARRGPVPAARGAEPGRHVHGVARLRRVGD